jgi:hypothetical protein
MSTKIKSSSISDVILCTEQQREDQVPFERSSRLIYKLELAVMPEKGYQSPPSLETSGSHISLGLLLVRGIVKQG